MPLKGSQPFLHETPEGNLPYKPHPRVRSEASFSEFHYDNTSHPPAGVPSARLWHHHSKDCSRDTNHDSQFNQVIRMTPTQEFNAQFESLEGPRLDPARVAVAAGDLSPGTKIKVTLLANHQHEDNHPLSQKSSKAKRAPGFILDVSRKSPAACKPPSNCDPLRPDEEKFARVSKRHGYKIAESNWTWNECNEVSGFNGGDWVNMHDPNKVLAGLSPMDIKMHTSVKGEKKYNVCGVQDMLPAAQEKFTKGDAPPSARHIYENNKRYLQGFERGVSSLKTPGEGVGADFLGSTDMWASISGRDNPLDKYRANVARDTERTEIYNRRSMLSTPTGSEYSLNVTQRMPQGEQQYMRASPGGSRASPNASGFEFSPNGRTRGLQSDAGSRTSRASVTSSCRELGEKQRWK